MTNDMRGLSDAEIDTVAGGFFMAFATMVGSCIENELHGPGETGDTGDTGADADTDADSDTDTDTDTDTGK